MRLKTHVQWITLKNGICQNGVNAENNQANQRIKFLPVMSYDKAIEDRNQILILDRLHSRNVWMFASPLFQDDQDVLRGVLTGGFKAD